MEGEHMGGYRFGLEIAASNREDYPIWHNWHVFCIYFNPMTWCELQEMSAAVIEGNDPVTGHIISTTIGGKNGEPKQVRVGSFIFLECELFLLTLLFFFLL